MTKLNVEIFRVGPIETNCLLVWPDGEDCCWVVDPGGLCGAVIDAIGVKKLRVEKIIITHGHWDHFFGNKCLKREYPEAQIAIHELDAGVLPDASANMSLAFLGKSILSPPADLVLRDGDELVLGSLRFVVIHTPGHSRGAVCLYCGESEPKVVFAGDLIFAGGGVGRTDLPGSSHSALKESLRKIFEMLPDEAVVYPGHGDVTTIGEERRNLGF